MFISYSPDRYDYVSCDTESCNKMMEDLEKMCVTGSMVDEQFSYQQNSCTVTFTVAEMDIFDYEDPTDGKVVNNQVRIPSYSLKGIFIQVSVS